MDCIGIQHVSLLVDDMEACVAFYQEVLGLPEVPRPSTFGGDPRLAVRWFAIGPVQQIHLMPASDNDGHHRRHFCIQVADAAAARAEVEARGLATEDEVEIPGIVRFFTYDPCGNRIELAEWTAGGPANP